MARGLVPHREVLGEDSTGRSLDHDLFLLFLHHALVHICLEKTYRIYLSDDLKLELKAFIAKFIPLNGFLDERNIGSKVESQLLRDVCD